MAAFVSVDSSVLELSYGVGGVVQGGKLDAGLKGAALFQRFLNVTPALFTFCSSLGWKETLQ